mmetsp:Transcript_6013/g.14906  ORF Transcript_6013/g.14906 Transcript_6013/m.14906 type:complete len:413 (-) Transcript_6013:2825-4063(-)
MSSPSTIQSKNDSTMTADGGASVPAGATTNPSNTNTNTNNKRPMPETTSDGSVDTSINEKRRKRLEKNRLSARECRRRKKEATEQMQHEINLLEGENLRLRLQLQIGEEAEKTNFQEQNKLTEGLDELLKSGASESEIYTKIEEYKEKFADYGRDRRSAIEFHLRNVERLLMPTQTTSVIMATLQGKPISASAATTAGTATNAAAAAAAVSGDSEKSVSARDETNTKKTSEEGQPDTAQNNPGTSSDVNGSMNGSDNGTTKPSIDSSAISVSTTATTNPPTGKYGNRSSPTAPPKDTKALFTHLVNILQVTPEQATALKDSRFVAQEMDEILKEALSVLKELRTRLTQCGQDLDTEFSNVRAILTPSQSAKFLVWVAQNKACIHLLNELWNKVYPTAVNPQIEEDGSGEASP